MTAAACAQVPAFPGAYGFGANATGGRGGTVYHVTNLGDSGPGSFRDAVSQPDRIIVFDVGGYIVLKSPVSVNGNLTIAGQTAPGGGIGIMGGEVSLSNKSNIIMRNVRIRQGNLDPLTGKSALGMSDSSDIILDHCSFEYGQWDSVDAVGGVNFTVQNSIIADPIEQQFGAHVEVGPSTFYRNLWVNVHNRQPLSKDNTQYINNIIYDYELGYTSGNTGGKFSHDIINNYFIAGPMTSTPSDAFFQMNANQSVYATGNMVDSTADGILNGASNNTVGSSLILNAPWAATTTSIPALSAADAYPSVLAGAGAFPRDEVDNFVTGDAASLGLKGQLYKDQAVTGLSNDGYGTLTGGTEFPNQSGDGIADYWAAANGISTSDASAGNVQYGTTGYTNLEVYINSLVLPAPWSAGDIAGTPMAGASSYNPFKDEWLLIGSGQNASTTFDAGQFASQAWSVDGSFTTKLLSISDAMAEGGIMVRGSNDADSAFVALVADSSGSVSLLSRNADGQSANGVQLRHGPTPLWLRVVRKSGTYAGYISVDGSHWRLVGIANATLPETSRVGLVAASGGTATFGTAAFTSTSLDANTGTPVTLSVSDANLTYPASTKVVVTVAGTSEGRTHGIVRIFDGSTRIATLPLMRDGKAYWDIHSPLGAGTHLLTAAYTGDEDTPPGFSTATSVVVAPAAVRLSAWCWNASVPYGSNYTCFANVSSDAGAPAGTLEYTVDGAPASVRLDHGNARFSVAHPGVGTHTVTLEYPAQGNFAASETLTENFTVTPDSH
ncbi:hypothetical protein GCM10011507_19020 [Edaphobacter acidisoli]|uniref:Bacterial Ig-like domain-containing protein n=2 Tax=Edaphobacter acidisoli TaxID=2040573 RepID=A0A916W5D2_9BACT|nr:hypothetical protein GCM10011507_19020 [Edaphobacter acidisoli]